MLQFARPDFGDDMEKNDEGGEEDAVAVARDDEEQGKSREF